jgi:hypothetical protein
MSLLGHPGEFFDQICRQISPGRCDSIDTPGWPSVAVYSNDDSNGPGRGQPPVAHRGQSPEVTDADGRRRATCTELVNEMSECQPDVNLHCLRSDQRWRR